MALSVEQQSKAAELDALLANMEPRRRINLLLSIGLPAELVMGVLVCDEHTGGKTMSPTEPLSFDGSSVWCKNCFQWWKVKISA